MDELKIVYLRPEILTPYENNARKHAKEDIDVIKASIQENGFCDPIGIWGDKNIIVEGHGRQIAAIELGITEVPCIRLDHLTEAQRREYALVHNKSAELSMWDDEALAEELAALDTDFDMSSLGFVVPVDDASIEPDVVEDDYDDPLPENPKAKRGDIYQLGNHRLMCGDSTSVDDVTALMNGELADILVTDPPYNVDYTGGSQDHLKIQNDNQSDAAFRQFLVDAFSAADMAIRPGAAFYIFHADSEGYNFRGACRDVGWQVRQCLIWNKNSLVLGRQDYQWKHEPCLYGWKAGAKHTWTNDRKQTTVIDYDRPTKSELHPTMKPIGLFDYLIRNNTHKGDKVLDVFGGSGTTIMACEQDGCKAYCMELDPRYVDAAINRWEKFTGIKAVLVNGE